MAHSGILYKVQKKMPHLEIMCLYVRALASGTIELDF